MPHPSPRISVASPTGQQWRIGHGEHHVVICEVGQADGELELISHRIASTLDEPYRIGGRSLRVRASVGGVLVSDDDADPSKLLSRADDAMYRVKWGRRRERRPHD